MRLFFYSFILLFLISGDSIFAQIIVPAFHGAYASKANAVVEPVLPPQSGGAAICDGSKATIVVPLTSSTGKVWMDRNLGASRAATSATDFEAYGCLYQWGRGNDGHASINWTSATAGTPVNGTTATLATIDVPGHGLFITNAGTIHDWRSDYNNSRWQVDTPVNNPCPMGYRVPTNAELTSEFTANGISNNVTAYASPFKFAVAGKRWYHGGFAAVGSQIYYWTSSISLTTYCLFKYIFNGSAGGGNGDRADGLSVRCIKT